MINKRIFLLGCLFLLQLTSIESKANVLGNMQTLAPNPDSLIFQNIHSSQTLEKNYFNIGFFSAYVRNEFSVYDNLVQPHYVDYKDKALTFDLIFAWGVTQNFELTYSMPGYFKQEPDGGQNRDIFVSQGINGHRIGGKYNISQDKTGGFAVAGSVDLTSSKDNPYIGNSPNPIWNFELIWDNRDRESGYGFNLGYRKRTPGDATINDYFLPVGDQLIASAGYVTGLSKKWRFHAELFGSHALNQDNHPAQKYIDSLEALLGGKYRLARNWWLHFGATAEVMPEGLAPEYRVYAGINHFFTFGSKSSATSKNSSSTLSVTPYELHLAPAEKDVITVTGGTAPYSYRVTNNMGYFDQSNMEFTAYDKTGEDELVVTDANGDSAIVPIHIGESTAQPPSEPMPSLTDPLIVTPTDTTVYTGGIVQLSASGGSAPYTATLSPARFGSISSETMIYRAPLKTGDVKVTVRDANGATAESTIHVAPVPKSGKAIVLKNLNFIFNTNKLTKESNKELDKNVANLSQVKIKKIIVIGHTDNIGSDEYNQRLSQSRAETVAKILRKKFNLRDDQVEAIGYGESQPIATNNTDAGRLTNRRVELKLYYNQ